VDALEHHLLGVVETVRSAMVEGLGKRADGTDGPSKVVRGHAEQLVHACAGTVEFRLASLQFALCLDQFVVEAGQFVEGRLVVGILSDGWDLLGSDDPCGG
jgi:hypothetical protein